ncbi:hypothetical protein K440DRAFT_661234 [Wilcoxina mikolae CBS 423.85]|nr:hypothetical protein K440DRAFT_661234 [Wilcoxina mikolae CBS 423.85]
MSQSPQTQTVMVNTPATPAHSLTPPSIATQTPPSSPPANGPAKQASPRKQYQRFRSLRLKARIFRGRKRNAIAAVPTSKARRTFYRVSRALITHGILLSVAGIVIGAVFAYYSNTISLKGNILSRDALELAKWTAEKDFREGGPSYIPECDDIFRAPLNPPPTISRNLRATQNTSQPGHNNRRTIHFLSNPVRTGDIRVQPPLSWVSLTKAGIIILAFSMLRICLRTRHEILRKAAQWCQNISQCSRNALEHSLLATLFLFGVFFHTITPLFFIGTLRCVKVLLLAVLAVPLLLICSFVYLSFLILEAIGRRKVKDRKVKRQSAAARDFLAQELEAFLEGLVNTFRHGDPFPRGS